MNRGTTARRLREAIRAREAANNARVLSKGKGPRSGYRDAVLEINGQRFPVFNETVGYKQDQNMTPILMFMIQISWKHNPTNRQWIKAKTLQGLAGKAKRHKYEIIKPGQGWH